MWTLIGRISCFPSNVVLLRQLDRHCVSKIWKGTLSHLDFENELIKESRKFSNTFPTLRTGIVRHFSVYFSTAIAKAMTKVRGRHPLHSRPRAAGKGQAKTQSNADHVWQGLPEAAKNASQQVRDSSPRPTPRSSKGKTTIEAEFFIDAQLQVLHKQHGGALVKKLLERTGWKLEDPAEPDVAELWKQQADELPPEITYFVMGLPPVQVQIVKEFNNKIRVATGTGGTSPGCPVFRPGGRRPSRHTPTGREPRRTS